ncbi:3-alpha-hydroxysteroid dehydrogenase [Rhodococcoides trifolii]|uniref:3-alpha-hydroxysteroid dehydrogenase n=1 Tax=Rhodococcoides trifolii TaxID=908250 RepID=A0A917LHS7_9NOCA|nr:SDR family oxidoreductase [Rhodococcus trifolii]GGG25956.1 3-alpha-hydroxysteroid dehydrogenase [Rhodococcus trifolii]
MQGTAVLITGATGGIGGACAQTFADAGATVYLTDVDDDAGRTRADTLGPNAHYHHLDVTDETDWNAITSVMSDNGHGLDVLVNSAGAAIKATLADTTLAQFRRMVDLNLIGTFLGLKAAARCMRDGGAIINLSSLRGVVATAELGAYGASKFGVRALTKVAALELAPRNIRVNAVCPGSIDTPITAHPDFADDDTQAYVRSIPLQRRGTPDEVASVVKFLASRDSSYMTGSDLLVDGGTAAGVRTPKKHERENN